MPRPHNFVSAFVEINVCPPPFFGKMFTKSTDKNRVEPPQGTMIRYRYFIIRYRYLIIRYRYLIKLSFLASALFGTW